MRAIVRRPYFDDLGLHKPGEVVEVETASDLVEIIAEGSKKEAKAEPKDEEPKPEKAKPTTKTRSTKKKG